MFPLLTGDDSAVSSRILVSGELISGTSVEVVDQAQITNLALIVRTWHQIDEPLIHDHCCRIDDLSRELGNREPMIGLSVIGLTLLGDGEATCLAS